MAWRTLASRVLADSPSTAMHLESGLGHLGVHPPQRSRSSTTTAGLHMDTLRHCPQGQVHPITTVIQSSVCWLKLTNPPGARCPAKR